MIHIGDRKPCQRRGLEIAGKNRSRRQGVDRRIIDRRDGNQDRRFVGFGSPRPGVSLVVHEQLHFRGSPDIIERGEEAQCRQDNVSLSRGRLEANGFHPRMRHIH